MGTSAYQRCITVMKCVHNNNTGPITIMDIATRTGIPQSSVRKTIFVDFPDYFFVGPLDRRVKLTGNMPTGINLEYLPVELKSQATKMRGPTKKRKGAYVWTWDKRAIKYLDELFRKQHGVSFREILVNAYNTNTLDELDVIGKTLVYAVREMRKDGKVSFDDNF